ncbi:hypothetical protein, partial [Serratia marcescens]|uniref:hypothetical protein n=1 Tax=Serratia marcescens TaxID=615 RepID=UPI001F14B6EF
MTPLPTLTVCEHCKKELPKSKCKYVKVQRYSDGRFKMVNILVFADRCASYYQSRQSIKSLQRQMHAIHRRPTW